SLLAESCWDELAKHQHVQDADRQTSPCRRLRACQLRHRFGCEEVGRVPGIVGGCPETEERLGSFGLDKLPRVARTFFATTDYVHLKMLLQKGLELSAGNIRYGRYQPVCRQND